MAFDDLIVKLQVVRQQGGNARSTALGWNLASTARLVGGIPSKRT